MVLKYISGLAIILPAQVRRSRCRDGMLTAITHKFGVGTSNMSGAHVLARHHQVCDISRIETAEGNVIVFLVTFNNVIVIN
jgi:hypothetical protein